MTSLGIRSMELTESGQKLEGRKAVVYVVLISFAVLVPALLFGIPSNVDLLNHFRFALPFAEAVSAGNFYPGWLAESNEGFGDPSFRFYPPALYYLLTLMTSTTGSWYSGTLLTFVFLSVVGGLGVYLWARAFLDPSASMCASAFYAVAPYHLNELYQASLLAEYAGCAVLPFVFAFAERIRSGGDRKAVAGLAAAYAGLILTHLPLTVVVSTALVIYAVARPTTNKRIKTLSQFGFAIGLGLTASAVYWTTMLSELSWVRINREGTDALVDYNKNFLLSSLSPENLNVWWMNILAFLTLLLILPALLLRWKEAGSGARTTMMLVVGSVVMALPISWPIWRLMPAMQQTQFPWRWLTVLSVAGAILAGAGLSQLGRLKRTNKLLVLGAMLISITFSFSHIIREARYLNESQFQQMLTTVRGSASVNYWFPVWASITPRRMETQVEAPGRSVVVDTWQAEHRRFTVEAGTASFARVKTFYYPHWTAAVGPEQLELKPDTDGALLVALPAESATIELTFREPHLSSYSGVASGIGWAFILALSAPKPMRRNI